MRDTTIFYRSFYEAIKELPLENQALIYDAIFSYALDFTEKDLTGICKTVFTLIKPQIDANNKRFENGTKPKTKQKESKTEAKDKQDLSKTEAKDKQDLSKTEANNNKNNNKKVNNNKNNNLNVNENNKEDGVLQTPLEKKFEEFLEYRKQIKKPVVEKSLQPLKNKLWELSNKNTQTAIDILDQTITNGWQGIFEIKNNNNGKQKGNNDEFLKAIYDEYNASKSK